MRHQIWHWISAKLDHNFQSIISLQTIFVLLAKKISLGELSVTIQFAVAGFYFKTPLLVFAI
jgi:hypothetical protein